MVRKLDLQSVKFLFKTATFTCCTLKGDIDLKHFMLINYDMNSDEFDYYLEIYSTELLKEGQELRNKHAYILPLTASTTEIKLPKPEGI